MDDNAPKAEQLTPEQQAQVMADFVATIAHDGAALGAMLGITFQPEQLQAAAKELADEQLQILGGVVPTIQDLAHPFLSISVKRGEESKIVLVGREPEQSLQTATLIGPKLLDASTTTGDVLASLCIYAMLFRPEFRMLLRAFGIQYGFAQSATVQRPMPPPSRRPNGRSGR